MDPKLFIARIMEISKNLSNEDIIKEEFNTYDLDSNGYLDRKELSKAAKNFYQNVLLKKISKEERLEATGKWFDSFDINKDGKIDINEFKEILHIIYAHAIFDKIQELKNDSNDSFKNFDLKKYLNDTLPTLSAEEQAAVKKFLESSEKQI